MSDQASCRPLPYAMQITFAQSWQMQACACMIKWGKLNQSVSKWTRHALSASMRCVQQSSHTLHRSATVCGRRYVALAQSVCKLWCDAALVNRWTHGTAGPPDILDNALFALVIADHCLGPSSASARIKAAQLAPLRGHWVLARLSTAVIWAAMHGLNAARR